MTAQIHIAGARSLKPSDASRIDILAIGHAPVLQINRRLYRALVRLGWNVEIAIPQRLPWVPSEAFVQPDDADDPPIHRLEPNGAHVRYWTFDGLLELLDRRRPRIVYLENGPESVMAWVAGGWCRRNNAALVVHTNENDYPSLREIFRNRQWKAAIRSLRSQIWGRVARHRVAHVIAICEDGRDAMGTIGYSDRTSVMPLGFDANLFFTDPVRRETARKALGLNDPVIAYFGRVTQQKGPHILAAALGKIKDRTWHFLIDEFERASDSMAWLDQAIDQAGIRERTVTFSASHDEMPNFMRAADIVVMPSVVKEQYGRVAPEAMACGCAVIVSDVGALPEVVGEGGLVVPSNDVDALSRAIADLVDNPERRMSLAARGQARATSELSMDKQAAMLDSLFREIIHLPPAAD